MAAKVPDTTLTDELPLYCEDQKDLLCAKHAINHILQEEKLVWIPGNENLYINKSDGSSTRSEEVSKKDVAINMWEFCGVSDAEARVSVEGEPGEAACKGNGNLAFDRIPSLIRLLGYDIFPIGEDRADALYSAKTPKRLFMAELMAAITQQCVLGAVINLGKSHYTAIVKNVRGCRSNYKHNGKLLTGAGYAYMDSNGPGGKFIGYCGNIDELERYLNTLPIVACLFIADRADGYDSVTASRRRRIHPLLKTPCTDEIKPPTPPSAPLMNDPTGTAAPTAPSAAPTGTAAAPTGTAEDPTIGGGRKYKKIKNTRKSKYRVRKTTRKNAKFLYKV